MAHSFARTDGRVVGRLDADEREVLVSLLEQVRSLLPVAAPAPEADPFEALVAGWGSAESAPDLPPDPALARLLPPAHHDDPEAAAEFARLAGPGIAAAKAARLEAACALLHRGDHGDEVRWSEEEARTFTMALTDVRLVVGDRLGMHTEADAEELERVAAAGALSEEGAWLLSLYDFLTWLQESVTLALMAGLSPGDSGSGVAG